MVAFTVVDFQPLPSAELMFFLYEENMPSFNWARLSLHRKNAAQFENTDDDSLVENKQI